MQDSENPRASVQPSDGFFQFFAYLPRREKRLSPRRAPRRSLLPLSPKRTQVRLKSLLFFVWLTPDSFRDHGRPSGKSAVCGLNGLRPTLGVGALHLNPRPRSAPLLLRPLSVGRFASL